MDWMDIALKAYVILVGIYYGHLLITPNRGSPLSAMLEMNLISPIQLAMSDVLPGYAQFQFPKKAKYGEKIEALITIQPDLLDESVLGKYGIKATSGVSIKQVMRVSARSKDCDVENASDETQALNLSGPTKWAVYLLPKKMPVSNVTAVISVIIDHKGSQVPYEVLRRSFAIVVSPGIKFFVRVGFHVVILGGAIASIIQIFRFS